MKRLVTRSFLFALVLLLTAEMLVRVFFARNMSGRFDYGYHPTAGFVERPDGSLDLVRAGGRRFRPQSLKQKPDPGVLRIFVIGDSVPRGPGLEEAYAGQIGLMLQARGVAAESCNLAVAGYGARRSQLVLREALRYDPGLVILHVNNSNEFEDEREWRRSQEFKSWHPRNWLMKSLVLRRLYEIKTEKIFWEWLPPAIRNRQAVRDADAEITAGMDDVTLRLWNELVRATVADSVAFCRARGVPVILVAQAVLVSNSSGNKVIDGSQVLPLLAALAGDGVDVLSMKEVLEPLDYINLYADASHLRASGHEVLARAMVDLIVKQGIAAGTSRR